jgi:hypothetical protein
MVATFDVAVTEQAEFSLCVLPGRSEYAVLVQVQGAEEALLLVDGERGRLTRPARIAFWFSAGRPVDAARRPSERRRWRMSQTLEPGSYWVSFGQIQTCSIGWSTLIIVARAVASTQVTG